MKPKNIKSEKVQVLVKTRTWVLKSQQFHEQVVSVVVELSLKDFLVAATFLVPFSSGTGFARLFGGFGAGRNSFITGFNDWKHANEFIGITKL